MQVSYVGELLRRPVRKLFSKRLYGIAAAVLNWSSCVIKIGIKDTVRLREAGRGRCGTEPVEFRLPQLRQPFYVRPGTTDASGIVQNVVRQEWGAFLPSAPIRMIVDAGANCGDTTAWYLSKFPEATVVAIEPDPGNFAILRKNCGSYGSRAVLLNAALWSRDSKLNVRSSDKAVGISVEESEDGPSGACEGLSMPQLLRLIKTDTIDILKMDIEGAELQLFSSNPQEWVPRVRYLAVETHGPKHREVVYSAMSPFAYENRIYRNVHIFRRRPD